MPPEDADSESLDAARHELVQFLDQDQAEMAAEYQRIYNRSTQDPGTAGDEGENNWASFLAEWLPGYQIVTKGRVLFPDGEASPQLDVIVLSGAYPKRLLEKKLFLSSGVIAAFECKTTLRSEHLASLFETVHFLKSRSRRTLGSIRDELTSPVTVGLLAHSTSWKSPGSTPIDNIDTAMSKGLSLGAMPWELPDLVCVADLGCWTLGHFVEAPFLMPAELWQLRVNLGAPAHGHVLSQFTRWKDGEFETDGSAKGPNPLAVLIAELLNRLGWANADLRPLADYFRIAGLLGRGTGLGRSYGLEVLSPDVLDQLRHRPVEMGPNSFWSSHTMVVS